MFHPNLIHCLLQWHKGCNIRAKTAPGMQNVRSICYSEYWWQKCHSVWLAEFMCATKMSLRLASPSCITPVPCSMNHRISSRDYKKSKSSPKATIWWFVQVNHHTLCLWSEDVKKLKSFLQVRVISISFCHHHDGMNTAPGFMAVTVPVASCRFHIQTFSFTDVREN